MQERGGKIRVGAGCRLFSVNLALMGHMQSQGFDYIVIGAGSAGGLLTYRLPQIPDLRISLLEAGSGVETIGTAMCPT